MPSVQWFDDGATSASANEALTATAYHWLRANTDSRAEAEALTVEVFRRSRQPAIGAGSQRPTLDRLKVLVVQTLLAHRQAGQGLTPADRHRRRQTSLN